jgi:hypothetical protein
MASHVIHPGSFLATEPAVENAVWRMNCAEVLGEVTSLEEGRPAHLAGKTFF